MVMVWEKPARDNPGHSGRDGPVHHMEAPPMEVGEGRGGIGRARQTDSMIVAG